MTFWGLLCANNRSYIQRVYTLSHRLFEAGYDKRIDLNDSSRYHNLQAVSRHDCYVNQLYFP